MLLPQVWKDGSRYEETCIEGHAHIYRGLMQEVRYVYEKVQRSQIF